MTIGLLFWILYIIFIVLSTWLNWPATGNPARSVGGWALVWVLIGLLGWQVFGPALHK